MIARSPAMRAALDEAARAASQPGGVLIYGEPGSGRRLIAREVHRRSAGDAAPFEEVDCASIGPGAVEAVLFGTPGAERGDRQRLEPVAPSSLLCRAQGGTLYLAHLDALPSTLQRRLARVLGDGALTLVGSSRGVLITCRLIASADAHGPPPTCPP